jgi:hypothetical protein
MVTSPKNAGRKQVASDLLSLHSANHLHYNFDEDSVAFALLRSGTEQRADKSAHIQFDKVHWRIFQRCRGGLWLEEYPVALGSDCNGNAFSDAVC